MSASPDVRDVEALGRELSGLIGTGALAPEAEEALGSLIGLSRRLEADKAGMAATVAAQEGRIAELVAQIAALTHQVAQLQRDLHGSRSEKRKEGGNGAEDANRLRTCGRREPPPRRQARTDEGSRRRGQRHRSAFQRRCPGDRHHGGAARDRGAVGGRVRGDLGAGPLPACHDRLAACGHPLPPPQGEDPRDRDPRERTGPRGRVQEFLRRCLVHRR